MLRTATIIFALICAANSIAKAQTFKVTVEGDQFPVIRGTTDMPNGTKLIVWIKKPFRIDAQQLIAAGLSACGYDCIPASGPSGQPGAASEVVDGAFKAGPFSFKGKPIDPGKYPLEITFSADIATATPAQISRLGSVLYSSQITIR